MLRHYLLIVWRNSRKSPLYSIINVAGLSLGMAVAMLIGLWVWNEMSFDHYHRNHERMGEVLSITRLNGTVGAGLYSSVPVAAALRTQYPDDFTAVSVVTDASATLSTHDKTLRQWGAWVEAEFPEMFSLKMIRGSSGALSDPTAILLTASFARDLFGTTDVEGRPLLMGDSTVLRVGGVYEDLPENTTMSMYRFLLPFDNIHSPGREAKDDWIGHHFQVFVQLKPGMSMDAVSGQIRDITKPHIKGGWEEIALHPMDKWHLYDRSENGVMTEGRLQTVRLFGFIGVLVLLLACINFMNLSTARSEKRAKEVGIRKTAGSLRGQLVGQFLCESIAMTIAALLLALLLAALGLPFFNGVSGGRLVIPWGSGWWWMVVLGFTIITGVLAGAYPAFYLSAFRPTKVLKGALRVGRLASLPRQVLVVLQFAISMSLIIGTMVVYQQLGFARNRPVGYSREGMITMYVDRPALIDHADALRQELLATGAIREMAATSSATTEVRNDMLGYDWEGRDPRSVPVIGTLFVSYNFGRTVDWTIKEGRDFIPGNVADSGAFVINEAAAKYMGLKHPVGGVIRWGQVDHPIVGVVKDLVMESPYKAVKPVFYTMKANSRIQYLVVRLNPGLPVKDALARIEPVFRRWDPVDPFEYWFTDEAYGAKFADEVRMGKLAGVFAALAVVISCLGLFGLAAFVAEQRTKEIGIRKVLGASVAQLWGLLSKEFLLLVGLSFCLGAPVAFLYLRGWLQAYEYRVSMSPWVFLAAGAGGVVITLVTVSGQAVRAALMNPVRSLKAE